MQLAIKQKEQEIKEAREMALAGYPIEQIASQMHRAHKTIATHAYAHHNHKEEVFGEWVFSFQGAIPFSPHKGKQAKVFIPSPVSTLRSYK